MDRDGGLDLLVSDANPTIYWNTLDPLLPFVTSIAFRTEIPLAGERGEIWAIRAIDVDGDGTLELAIANRSGPSLLLANYSPALNGNLTQIADAGTAGSVAWGDVNNDGLNDLLMGAAANRNTSRLFLNNNGSFSFERAVLYDADAIGRQTAMLGDLDANLIRSADAGGLDVVLVTPTGVRISRDQGELTTVDIPGLNDTGHAAALGDADGDGDLDLAVASINGPVYLVENRA
jgi:hypothetical protein